MRLDRPDFPCEQRPTAFGHLSVHSLSVERDGLPILKDVSFDVGPGEIVALLGRDGAGKTTCFEAIAGLTRATSGEVRLNGVDISDFPIDHRAGIGLGYLPEDISIFRALTVEDNILLALESSETGDDERAARLEALLGGFELSEVRHQLATTLSGGERRRCEVARTMALNPSIFLLDEPFRGLDPTSIGSIKRVIATLKRQKVGVFVSDYDLHDLLELTDRVCFLHQGRLIFTGGTQEFLANGEVRDLFLGESFLL